MEEADVDRVLTAPPPTFTVDDVARFSRELFGIEGTAVSAGSERDQAFLIDGDRPSVLKISNAAEDPARLDLEALAAQRVADLDEGVPVALPLKVMRTGDYKQPLQRGEATHYARMYERIPRVSFSGTKLSDDAIRDWGTMAARVGRALRGFWHPLAGRVMLWDVQHALRLRRFLESVHDAEVRSLVGRALDRYEQVVTPVW